MANMRDCDYIQHGDVIQFGDGHRVNAVSGECSCGSLDCRRIRIAQLLVDPNPRLNQHEREEIIRAVEGCMWSRPREVRHRIEAMLGYDVPRDLMEQLAQDL